MASCISRSLSRGPPCKYNARQRIATRSPTLTTLPCLAATWRVPAGPTRTLGTLQLQQLNDRLMHVVDM